MNYFQLFDIKPAYILDGEKLHSKYLELQKKFHPDNCSTTEEQLESIEKTILINDSYAVLSDEVKLIIYFLKTQGYNLSDKDIQQELSQYDLLFLLDLKEKAEENKDKISEYKQTLKERTLSIRLTLIEELEKNKKDKIKQYLAKLIFFNKALKHLD